jgi:hypothetical protein
MFRNDFVSLSTIYYSFNIVMVEYKSKIKCLLPGERSCILKLVQERLQFMYDDATWFAYLLDPVNIGLRMNLDHRLHAEVILVGIRV